MGERCTDFNFFDMLPQIRENFFSHLQHGIRHPIFLFGILRRRDTQPGLSVFKRHQGCLARAGRRKVRIDQIKTAQQHVILIVKINDFHSLVGQIRIRVAHNEIGGLVDSHRLRLTIQAQINGKSRLAQGTLLHFFRHCFGNMFLADEIDVSRHLGGIGNDIVGGDFVAMLGDDSFNFSVFHNYFLSAAVETHRAAVVDNRIGQGIGKRLGSPL